MKPTNFFPQRQNPKIYAYTDSRFPNCLKIGYTTKSAEERVKEQYPVKLPNQSWEIVLEETAIRDNGTLFTDKDIHRLLKKQNVPNINGEWFECNIEAVKAALVTVKTGKLNIERRTQTFKMRPEQEQAVEKTIGYFKSFKEESPGQIPHFLWNAKMRFGKTFTSYQLAKKAGWKRILILTFKPAVENAWEEDLKSHLDFEGWRFVSRNTENMEDVMNHNQHQPLVCFGSFQDYLGKNTKTGGIKTKNEWVHLINWDCVIFDEYHFGAWREHAKDLFEAEETKEISFAEGEGMDYFDEDILPITTNHYLYLSGTPFRAIASGEFIEEQIFNWTYSDEQEAKESWGASTSLSNPALAKQDNSVSTSLSNPATVRNPYAALPRMVMLTYQLPEAIRQVATAGEFSEFDLNEFFTAIGTGAQARFKYENEVQKWLDLIRGSFVETTIDNLKLGAQKPVLPFSHAALRRVLNHTFWFLPSVASCHAMANLLSDRQNTFYHDFKVIVAAGTEAGIGLEALPPVKKAMGKNPLESKTITLSCGKLTTGVTVAPWTGIFMLRNSSSPETYFQAAFRVQSPWSIKNPDLNSPNQEVILKEECYVFDFAPERALKQIAEYSTRLNVAENNPEKKVADFIHFLPILAYDGSSMKQIDAAGILDMAMSGTTATLLARRWESALLVNVDNNTLARLMKNEAAMKALMSIEGFRSLNQDIETIINKSEAVKKIKKEKNDGEMTPKEKKELTEQEKEYKSLRKQIQEKLIKFATRIPVFMYLTDYREHSLQDVIRQLEPGLFKKVTGLEIKDFDLLVSLGVFNSALMNDAVFKFKRYEDASLEYMGINKHKHEAVGGYDTVLNRKDYNAIFVNEPESFE